MFDPGTEVVLTWYRGRTKQLSPIIDTLEKATRPKAFVVIYADIKRLWYDFKQLFRYIKAAGGLVYNDKGEILLIFRRGFWDLPKGKIEVKEGKRTAAIREVCEETGLKNVEIKRKIGHSFHSYRLKTGVRALKKSIWYEMVTADEKLIPQTEEDIQIARWISPTDIPEICHPMYPNIKEILRLNDIPVPR